MIAVKNLDIRFGLGSNAVHAVRDVSFVVETGESFGLVGESGSGKSTVLRALSGLNRRWHGSITVDGVEQEARRGREFYRQLQMVFQDPYGSLHPRHTINQILGEPLKIHRQDNTSARIGRALDDVGLDASFRFRYPHQLSGGQRQRVAIARAMILEPKVLLLDEPTSALDVSVQAEVLNLLSGLRKARKLTYILVSHDLAVVAYMCDRVAVMNHGQIIEQLDVAELRAGVAKEPYTRQLLQASVGFDRETARELIDYL